MNIKDKSKFNGFSPNTLNFLRDLAENNNKIWFEAHRENYEEYLLQPMRNLVIDLSNFILNLDPYIEVTPAVNKTISRIFRDTRFSHDKSLFRSNMWITFKNRSKDWTRIVSSYFFELNIDSYRYGMGFYKAAPAIMSTFRQKIDENPDEFLETISFYSKQQSFILEGEKYKRIFDKNKPIQIQDWYQRKNLCLICYKEINETLFSNKLVDELITGFNLISPLYHYLQKIKIE